MIQTIFEEMGGTYSQHGDYLLPNLVPTQEEESTESIGTWGRQHLDYLRQHKQVHYTNLLTSGKHYNCSTKFTKRLQSRQNKRRRRFGRRRQHGKYRILASQVEIERCD